MGVSKKLLTPSVIDAVVKKVNDKRITNSKDLRKLRAILPDPVARTNFLSEAGDLETAMLRLGPKEQPKPVGLEGDLDAAVEAMKNVPWTTLQDLKGNKALLEKIEDAEKLLRSLRAALS
jgi:ParB family chromosome partitioning protein